MTDEELKQEERDLIAFLGLNLELDLQKARDSLHKLTPPEKAQLIMTINKTKLALDEMLVLMGIYNT